MMLLALADAEEAITWNDLLIVLFVIVLIGAAFFFWRGRR